MYDLSVCVFIKDTFSGAFCLFESMASLLVLADHFIVMDLGSTDGTLDRLREIERANPKVKVVAGDWPVIDAGAFATLANDLVAMCPTERVLYYQADEIWHEDLLGRMEEKFQAGEFDLSFWRIQYANNFQYVKWFPHLVHRVGVKGRFNFVGDGMTTDRTWDAKICSQYDGGWFSKWGGLGDEGIKPYVNEMIMDVSLVGGFRDNIVERRAKHAPFWHEEPTVPYFDKQTKQQLHRPASQWLAEAMADADWTRPASPYNLPAIMRYHIGKVRYELRADLLEAIKADRTADYIEYCTEGGDWR